MDCNVYMYIVCAETLLKFLKRLLVNIACLTVTQPFLWSGLGGKAVAGAKEPPFPPRSTRDSAGTKGGSLGPTG